jgi:hypothetical protein
MVWPSAWAWLDAAVRWKTLKQAHVLVPAGGNVEES